MDRARFLARRRLTGIGDELCQARLTAGLTQTEVAQVVGISRSQVSRIEHGLLPHVAYATLVLIGATVGLDVPLRTFPGGEPVRDAAQLALLSRFMDRVHPSVRKADEVPLPIPGDQRAWDRVLSGRGWSLTVEAESRLRDVQALLRRLALKLRDDGGSRLILLVADTRHNRDVLRFHDDSFADAFPGSSRDALRALEAGRCPERSSIIRL